MAGESNGKRGPSELSDTWEKWRGLIGFALVGGAIFAASRFDATRPFVALVVAMAAPVAAFVVGFGPLRAAAGTLRIAAAAVALLAVAAAELELAEVFFPGAPLGEVTLSPSAPDARVSWPAAGVLVELGVHGDLLARHGTGSGSYTLVVKRGSDETTLSGQLSRTVSQGRRPMRRMAPSAAVSRHLTDRHEVSLAGSGQARVHLDSTDGLQPSVHVTVREPPAFDRWLVIALGVAIVLATIVEAAATKAGYTTQLTAALGASSVLAFYVAHRFDADDPFTTVAGGALVGLAAGGLGGWLLGKIVSSFVKRPTETTPPRRPYPDV